MLTAAYKSGSCKKLGKDAESSVAGLPSYQRRDVAAVKAILMLMRIWGGENYVSEQDAEVTVVIPGVGRIVCPECGGDPEKYASLFPPEVGITECVDCKGTGRVFVSI